VLLALTNKQNAILESPTGTGKVRRLEKKQFVFSKVSSSVKILTHWFYCYVQTLCLLCATLAWRRQLQKNLGISGMAGSSAVAAKKGASLAYEGYGSDGESDAPQVPRIIYSSRTHSQLKQVVQELKNTSYRPNVAVLGSREHLCVNDKVSKLRGTRQNLACRSTCKDRRLELLWCGWKRSRFDADVVLVVALRRCMYKLGFDSYAKRSKKQAQPIMDIEELVSTMKEKTVGSCWCWLACFGAL
jgi:Rad3-related DNA helicase